MKRFALLVLAAMLMSCSEPKAADDLPSASKMQTEGQVKAPQQAREFCAEQPEFEKCR